MCLMMMNCFCGMVDRRKAFSLISNRYHCLDQRSSSSRISDTPQAGFEPELRLYWMKLCSSDNHYTTAPPPNRGTIIFFISNWFTHHCHKLVLTQCSSYIKLPEWIARKKVVINPKTIINRVLIWQLLQHYFIRTLRIILFYYYYLYFKLDSK